jgi:hypothetical protein
VSLQEWSVFGNARKHIRMGFGRSGWWFECVGTIRTRKACIRTSEMLSGALLTQNSRVGLNAASWAPFPPLDMQKDCFRRCEALRGSGNLQSSREGLLGLYLLSQLAFLPITCFPLRVSLSHVTGGWW